METNTKELLMRLAEDPKGSTPGSKLQQDDHYIISHSECVQKCVKIFPLLVDKLFATKYWTTPDSIPDCYVFSYSSQRCLILEVATRFPKTQMENLHTYKFCTHPLFQEKLKKYTKFKGNSDDCENSILVRSRPWDVALNVVMKIEALPEPYDKSLYLLRREHFVLDYLWERHLSRGVDIDEMTGIPMVFEYVEVPNDVYLVTSEGQEKYTIDPYGKTKPMQFEPGSSERPTLSYMTMEKLGPNVSYLQQLVRAASTTAYTFDLWTALKIFDQLLCRIMQVHRFSVVHNDICPENIYMGKRVAFDVVYLNNFKRAYIVAEGDTDGPSGLASTCVGCNVRFASCGQLGGTARLMQPIDDVESAFYVLLALLSADALPWDCLLKRKLSVGLGHNASESSSSSDLYSGHNEDQMMMVGMAKIPSETLRKVFEFKQRFWQSNHMLNMVLSNAAFVFTSDSDQAANIASVICELYYRVKDWRQTFTGVACAYNYFVKLNRPSSEEFRQFIELRRCALVNFKFSETFDIINDLRFRNRVAHRLSAGSFQQQPWNALVWCFNNIEIKCDTKQVRD